MIRHRVTSIAAAACALLVFACENLVEDVPTSVCASGKRWIGGNTGHEEMNPGQDCIGCHRQKDGPEFMIAGTVYGIYDADGSRTVGNDCFGIEGARITVTAADGQVVEARSNRAGNFFVEGPASELVKPLRVVVEYDLPDGRLSRQPMGTRPSYGGCNGCHGTSQPTNTESCPGTALEPSEVIQVTPLYSGVLEPGPTEPPLDEECPVQ